LAADSKELPVDAPASSSPRQSHGRSRRFIRPNQLDSRDGNQGENEKALQYYEEALDISREKLGDRHRSVATTLNNIAGVDRAQVALQGLHLVMCRCAITTDISALIFRLYMI